MSSIDWQLIIGYEWPDAENYLQEEGADYSMSVTKPPRKCSASGEEEELRVIAVRSDDEGHVQVICAATDWTIS